MASFSTTKTFVDGVSVAATDLNAITSQLSLANGAISDRAAAGAAVDADLFLVLKSGGGLQQMTALQLKTYLGQVFVPSAVNYGTTNTVITTAANVLSPTWTQLVTSLTLTTIAGTGRKVMFWVNANFYGAGSGITLTVYRSDNAAMTNGAQFFAQTLAGNQVSASMQCSDNTPLNGSTTYYLLAQASTANETIANSSFSAVQM